MIGEPFHNLYVVIRNGLALLAAMWILVELLGPDVSWSEMQSTCGPFEVPENAKECSE